jgi:hypothetical protein
VLVTREYKVVEVKKKSTFGFSRLDGEKLEDLLNDYGRQGWYFDKTISGETLYLDKDTIMMVFYRELPR